MTNIKFAILVFLSFALPVPMLAWLDRAPTDPQPVDEKLGENR